MNNPNRTPALRTLVAAVGISSLFCSGCRRPVHADEMSGPFDLKSGCGSLTLQPDHSFVQELAPNCSAPSQHNRGKWSLELSDGQVEQISFAPFLEVTGQGKIELANLRYFPIEPVGRSVVRIVVDEQRGLRYESNGLDSGH